MADNTEDKAQEHFDKSCDLSEKIDALIGNERAGIVLQAITWSTAVYLCGINESLEGSLADFEKLKKEIGVNLRAMWAVKNAPTN